MFLGKGGIRKERGEVAVACLRVMRVKGITVRARGVQSAPDINNARKMDVIYVYVRFRTRRGDSGGIVGNTQ